MTRRLTILLGSLALFLASGAPAVAHEDDEARFTTEAQDGSFNLGATSHLAVRLDDTATTTSSSTLETIETTYEDNDLVCALRQYADQDGSPGNEVTDLCEDEDGLSTAELVELVSQEFQTLPLAAPAITHQPDGNWALVNVDFIVLTDAQVQVLETTILGVPVAVRATPVHYSWDFGDGSAPLVTTDPGQPYPNQTVAHVYITAADAVSVSLTTSWQGELQLAGSDAWLPIAGMATTTTAGEPVEIVAMDVHLVPNP